LIGSLTDTDTASWVIALYIYIYISLYIPRTVVYPLPFSFSKGSEV
jgi:hypothetical protein